GRDLAGVHYAMEYLTAQNRMDGLPGSPIDAAGKHVIVIGGGDTGADCVGTAHRQGAASVTSLAIGRRPAETRTDAQPWPVHPTLFEVSSSHEEGGERKYLASTVEFVGDDAGRVTGLRVAETGFTEEGRVPIPGTEHLLEADLVLIAMGFTGPEAIEDAAFPLPVARRGAFARAADFSTELPGVYVAGDAGRGQSLIVWAIAEGRAAAAAVDRHLTGATELPAPVGANDRAFA
ncbi:glutamate synthase, partial [Leucobacter sp. OLES1]